MYLFCYLVISVKIPPIIELCEGVSPLKTWSAQDITSRDPNSSPSKNIRLRPPLGHPG
jgi:uncharacterized membrane protein